MKVSGAIFVAMAKLAERITVKPKLCGGQPCVRGTRIRVVDLLELLAAGLSPTQVWKELPDLEPEDIKACLRYASQRLRHPVLAVLKIWLDAQLSPSLAVWLSRRFKLDVVAVRDVGLRNAEDREIFDAARKANVVVVTKDRAWGTG